MIPSARHSVPPVVIIIFKPSLFCLAIFLKAGTDGNLCEINDHYRPEWINKFCPQFLAWGHGSIEKEKTFSYDECFSWRKWKKTIIFISLQKDNFLIHSAKPQSRPIGIIVFAHVVRTSVHPFPLFKSSKRKQRKQCSLLARLWVWPSGSLMKNGQFVFAAVLEMLLQNCQEVINFTRHGSS